MTDSVTTVAQETIDRVVSVLSASDAPTGAVGIIQAVARASATKEDAIAMLRLLAAGRDGLPGTPDDLLSPETVDILAYLIQRDVAAGIVDLVAPALARGGGCPFLCVVRVVGGLISRLRCRSTA